MSTPQSFRHAVKWAFVMNWGRQGITALVFFVLAYFLGPEQFGTVAMAGVYIWFNQMLTDQGFSAALIQRKKLDPEHLDTAFWLVFGLSAVLTVLTWCISGWWGQLMKMPELGRVINTLSVAIPLSGLAVVQEAYLKREMNFKALAVRSNLAAISSGVVGITMAVCGYGVWALVGQNLCIAVVSLATLWASSPWRPSLRFSKAHAKELLPFSGVAFVDAMGSFLYRQSDALLMGFFFGPVAVGVYRLASRITNLVTDSLTRSINAVALPHFSRSQGEAEELSRRFAGCARLSALMVFPAMATVAVLADVIMAVMGAKWAPAVWPLRVLCLVGMVQACAMLLGPLTYAMNRPSINMATVWAQGLTLCVLYTALGVWLEHAEPTPQALSIAGSNLAVSLLISVPVLLSVMRSCRVAVGGFLVALQPAVLTAAIAAAAAEAGKLLLAWTSLPHPRLALPQKWHAIFDLALLGSLAGLAGIIAICVFEKGVRDALVRVLTRVRPASAVPRA